MNRDVFYQQIRKSLFKGGLQQIQVDRINSILDAWDATDYSDNRWLAYALGTAHHESMVYTHYREIGDVDYFTGLYDITRNPRKAKILGNTNPGDGARFRGRGPDMLTGRDNYARESKKCGHDLLVHPEKAEEPLMAATRLIRNMHDGAYRKVGFKDFFAGNKADWVGARAIINHPSDKPQLVADYAQKYYRAIELAEVSTPAPLEIGESFSVIKDSNGETLGMIEQTQAPVPTPATRVITQSQVINHPLMAIFLKIIPPGYGTYVTLIVWIGLNIASAFGVNIPLFDAMQGNETIGGVIGFLAMRFRLAMTKEPT